MQKFPTALLFEIIFFVKEENYKKSLDKSTFKIKKNLELLLKVKLVN